MYQQNIQEDTFVNKKTNSITYTDPVWNNDGNSEVL